MSSPFKGILYPTMLPHFHRVPAPVSVRDLVQWFWIPEWDIEPGRTSRQQLIAFPTSNLVVQHDNVELAGPTTRVSFQDLTGQGWAVGALLRPAAVHAFTADPGSLRDKGIFLAQPELQKGIVSAMGGEITARSRTEAVAVFTDWLLNYIPAISAEALLANSMMEIIAADPKILLIEDAAIELSVSPRTLQRLAKKYVGLSPSALIRRRRLQEAADRARTDPGADLARIAAELGYADQAHLAHDFQKFLGFTASTYRRTTEQQQH